MSGISDNEIKVEKFYPEDKRTMGQVHVKYRDLELKAHFCGGWHGDYILESVIYKETPIPDVDDWCDFVVKAPSDIKEWYDHHKEGLDQSLEDINGQVGNDSNTKS